MGFASKAYWRRGMNRRAVQRKARSIGEVEADRAANRKRIAVQRTGCLPATRGNW